MTSAAGPVGHMHNEGARTMDTRPADEAYALAQRLFALWSATEWPRFDGRVYRIFRRAANRAVRRMDCITRGR
jgi:hypothetical protein